MIEKKDVIRMRIPFPKTDAKLARKAHMYICIENNYPKKFLKCQTETPNRVRSNSPPYQYIKTMPDIHHNPFSSPTLIDCDKSFVMDQDIVISKKLLTTRRRDISAALFTKLIEKIKHDKFTEIVLEAEIVTQMNDKIMLADRIKCYSFDTEGLPVIHQNL